MKALVVYESLFGNTETVARAVAEGISRTPQAEVTVADVRGVRPEYAERFDLVVVGGPTHAFSMSRSSTRADAMRQGAPHRTPDVGIREWLGQLPDDLHHEGVATFDTRVTRVRRLPGSAAKRAAHLAARLGMVRVAPPESFYVEDVSGPLVAGERERAVTWGETLGARAAAVPSR
ncbi:MAG: flavodoxin family protein [Nocardioides sp.]